MSGSSKKATIGYRYNLSIHAVLCQGPVDKITALDVDGKNAWTGESTGGTINVDANDLFGGDQREGGVSGAIDVLMGESTQPQNSYLQGFLGSAIPAFRGVCSVVYKSFYIGLNPYLKRHSWLVSRIHVRENGIPQWYDEKAEINGDMNPAHIIREVITSYSYGMGYSDSDVDDASFTASADTLYDEGMGISLLWDKSKSIQDFIELILRHIGGSVFVDRTTGKYKLKLVRDDYDVENLSVLGTNQVQDVANYKVNTLGELTNKVTVIYTDSETGEKAAASAEDTALVSVQGSTIATTKQFVGFTDPTIAARVAARELRAGSTPLASCVVYANREASTLNIGDVFKLNWPKLGIENVIMRVLNVELGTLTNNAVKISCIEDVYSLGDAIYAPVPLTGWTQPTNEPQDLTNTIRIEAPYWEIAQRLGDAEAQNKDEFIGYLLTTGQRPSDDAVNAVLYNRNGADYSEAGTLDFCPTAVITGFVNKTEKTLSISAGVDLDLVEEGTYLYLNQEVMLVNSVSSTLVEVSRGCLDTVPVEHNVGSIIYFCEDFLETDNIEYASGEQVFCKIAPTTALGTLAESAASALSAVMNSRMYRPYPAAGLTINGTYMGDSIANTDDLNVYWYHRDRLQQTASIISSEELYDIGPESGTTYEIRLYDENGSVIDIASGLTGNTHTFDTLTLGANYGNLTIELDAVRDGYYNSQGHVHIVNRAQ